MKKFAIVLPVILAVAVVGGVAQAVGTHASSEPTWTYQGIVANDNVKMKHVTVVHDPLGLAGVAGNPPSMMWWSPTSSTPDLLPSSDSGVLNSDNITDVTAPAFQGTAEAKEVEHGLAGEVVGRRVLPCPVE